MGGSGGRQGARTEGPDELRRGSGSPAPAERSVDDDEGQQRRRRGPARLDLDLAEAGGDALALEHGHLVVAHLAEARPPPSRSSTRCAASRAGRPGPAAPAEHAPQHAPARLGHVTAGRPRP